MTFFVTSVGPGKGADLGGIETADRHCQQLASTAGAGNKTWRAYLSTQAADGKPAVNARDRIGNGPWQNFKGEVVAQSIDDLHSDNNKLGMQTSLTENGRMIPGVGFAPTRHDALTGSRARPALDEWATGHGNFVHLHGVAVCAGSTTEYGQVEGGCTKSRKLYPQRQGQNSGVFPT
jgi:hypothetical protein